MKNSKYYPAFNQVCIAVENIFQQWSHNDLSHYKLLNLVISKIKDDFFSDKVAPALIGPTLAYRTIKGQLDPGIFKLAAAHFLFYAFLDVTDDVEDEDMTEPFLIQMGDALATNAGTSLLFISLLALDELKAEGISSQLISQIRQQFIEAGWHLTVGQHRDLFSRKTTPISPEDSLETMRLKTGTSVKLYFESAALLAAPQKPSLSHHFALLGESLGVLVQIVGDYLDIFAKPFSDDLNNQCQTLPVILCRERLNLSDLATLEACLGQVKVDQRSHMVIRHLITKSNCLEELNQILLKYRNQCLNMADDIQTHFNCPMDAIKAFIERIKPIETDGSVSV